MRLPTRDEVGDDQATLPIVFDVGRGDAPEELVRFGHLHAGTRWLHLERPDAGSPGRTAIIANMKMLSLGFEEAGAGVISEARRAGRDISSRRNNESGLSGILQLPDLLGHPAGKWTLFEADFTVERVHRLVFHFPTGISPFDDINDACGITLVGIIIHRESITEFIEGDFLRIT